MKIRFLSNRQQRRKLAAGALLFSLVGLFYWAHLDHKAARAERIESNTAQMQNHASLLQQVFLSEEEKLESLLSRVRSDLRTEGSWAQEEGKPAAKPLAQEGGPAAEIAIKVEGPVDAERWRAVRADLKRGLSARPDLLALDLVVADQAGLTSVRVARTEKGIHESFEDPRKEAGVAKAIWYADEVRRAVSANGRQFARGPYSTTETRGQKRTEIRVALALHDPAELIQGVLLATLDVSGVAGALETLTASQVTTRLVGRDGQPLAQHPEQDPDESADELAGALPHENHLASTAARDAALVERVLAAPQQADAFEADQRLVRGLLFAHGDGRISEGVALLEMTLPPTGLAAWAKTTRGMGVLGTALLALVGAIVLLFRSGAPKTALITDEVRVPSATVRAETDDLRAHGRKESPAAAAPIPDADDRIDLDPQEFVLRDWLADVRGCLEREAAMRGLSLNLRCERSMPQCIEQDPGWLGGLVLAMGQEALDATGEDRVLVRVREDAHEVMRIEVDAGPVELSPVRGMMAVAEEMGGRFEMDGPSGLAFVLPMTAGAALPA
ncbi:MAG: hypothetical protein AB8G23_16705 [Myxococcota bacterium]